MASSLMMLLVVALGAIHSASSRELGAGTLLVNKLQSLLKNIHAAEEKHEMLQTEQKMAEENTRGRVCYQDIGCFSKDGTFKHLMGLPDSPQVIQTSFALYTRSNPRRPVYLHYLNSTSVLDQTFDPTKPLKIICHGFAMSGDSDYLMDMRDAFLKTMDCNVLIIDWRRGALPPFYLSAALDTELVGRQVGRLVSLLVDQRGLQIADVHIIGFSLGAQLAGFAGKWLRNEYTYTLGRISALDPASFLFEDKGEDVHVSSKDANFVDVIHTSSGTSILSGELGMTAAVGHVDFYPNGGKQQPGCSGVICNHMRALDLFTSSIGDRCEFRAIACESFDVFDDGGCFRSTSKQIGRMGYHSQRTVGRGTLYLATTHSKPFCGTSTLVMMSVSPKQQKTYGAVAISMVAEDGTLEIINITDTRSQTIHPKEMLQKLSVVNPSVLPMSEVHVHYTYYNGWFYTGTEDFLFDHIKILDETGHIWFEYSIPGTKISSTKSKIIPLASIYG